MLASKKVLAMNLLAPVADKLGKLIRMLSSDRDGEVVAAAHAIKRTLQSAGADVHTLAGLIEKPSSGLSETDVRRIYDAGFQDGLRKAEDAQHGDRTFRNVDGTPDWKEVAQFCHERVNQLRPNEQQFVNDMAGRTMWREPSEKQGKWLLSIFYKLGGRP